MDLRRGGLTEDAIKASLFFEDADEQSDIGEFDPETEC